jgi:ribosomal protein L11 methyltransferase
VFEISIRLHRSQYLATEILLDEVGAVSISLEDAENEAIFVEQIDTSPLWQHITLTALFVNDLDLSSLQKTLEAALTSPVELVKREIQEQDWQEKWMQNLRPMQFGERLWVCPSWRTSPDPFAVNIKLDPGLAFGTGTHPTTALCLAWLANHSLENKTVMDFGCGSGILAIAAYYLGAKKVFAIDHDPQALQATRTNMENNSIEKEKIQLLLASEPPQKTCDVLIANVLLLPLLKFYSHFAKAMLPTSKIILSGILEGQLDEIKQVYQPVFNIENIHSKNEWLLIEATLNYHSI